MMFDPMHEKVKKWLENKIGHSELAVDHGWTVDVAEDNERVMIIDTPKMPFKITVLVEDELTYVAFVTGITTGDVPPEEAGPVFRTLLRKNKDMAISKFYLMGDDDTLCLRTDLYTKHMNKSEFNMALESIILGGRWLIAEMGQTEDQNRLTKEMVTLGSAELLKGTPKEDVVSKMTAAGVTAEEAEALVNKLAVELGLEEAPVPAKDVPAEPGDERDNPVDRYIW